VITLVLLHPLQGTPVQTWTFQDESVVRIGRAHDNDVVLLSAVVSRHHVEVRQTGNTWDVINLGTNGTYIEGKRVDKVAAQDGMVIRLARSGPKIQLNLTVHNSTNIPPHPQVQPSSFNESASSSDTSIYPIPE
jgi:pSer/pThr/pTyr-binding forkhead associated (FHA) protein